LQADECRRYLLARDPKADIQVVSDEFQTGRTLRRKALAAALAQAASRTAPWDTLVTLDMDRLARSLDGWVQIAKTLADAGKGLVCVRQDMDYRTPQGRMMLSLFAVVAEYFARSNAEKTRDKMLDIARKGQWPAGKVPMGYLRAGKRQNTLTLDAKAAAVVRDIFVEFAGGTGVVELSRKHGLPKNTLVKILANPVYIGRIRYADVETPGKHPAIVPKAVWDDAQARRPAPEAPASRPAARAYPYPLAGMVRCAEGHAMSPATCHGKGGKPFHYYRCQEPRCKAVYRYIRAEALEDVVCQHIAEVAYDRDQMRQIAAGYEQRIAEIMARYNEGGDLHERLRTVENRIRKLSDALSAASALPNAQTAILRDLDTLEREAKGLRTKAESLDQAVASVAGREDPEALAAEWQKLASYLAASGTSDPMRQAWCRAHIESIVVSATGTANITLRLQTCSTKVHDWHPEAYLVELPPSSRIAGQHRRLGVSEGIPAERPYRAPDRPAPACDYPRRLGHGTQAHIVKA
jgi:DNA invertase Pin-like site-specific DNA recombinase